MLAGGAGGRLAPLTDHRAKPAVPYGGTHRLIDFPLSNCLHSGISDIWVVEQFNPVSLADHLANGRPWDLDRTHGGLLVLHPRRGKNDEREGWHQGTADALWRNARLIREFGPEALLVLSADAVYRLDYSEVVAGHVQADAAVTMVTKQLPGEDVSRYGVVQVEDGRVREYAYKPDTPASDVVSNEVFVFTPEVVLDVLEELANQAGEEGLEDLGDALLPRLVADGAAREHRMTAAWRDVGTVEAYWRSHLDLVGPEPPAALDDPRWPIRTRPVRSGGVRLEPGAAVDAALVGAGSRIAGTVRRSVLGSGVVVERGAVVEESVLLHDVVVRAGAHVVRTVVDEHAEIGGEVGSADGEVTVLASPGV